MTTFKALFISQEMPRCQDFASFCRLKGRSLRSLHFPSILKKNPSIQNLNETTDIRNIYINADRFPFMMLTAAYKERKQI